MWAELNGAGQGWTDISADTQRVPSIQLDYGINAAGPQDLVAPSGHMTFALNNGPGNSANLLGYYSPGHSNCRSGFAIGIGIRLVYRVGGTGTAYYKFSGTLDSVEPLSGLYQERKTLCTVVDWMDEAAIYRPNVATQLSKRADEILTTLVAAVPRQPRGTSFDTGDSTFTYALDTDLNEIEPVLTVLQRLAQSEHGRIYVKGDTAQGGILTFESRSARYVFTPLATFNDTMISVSAPYERSLVVNKVKATTHPRTVGTVTTDVLFTLAQTSPTSIHSIAAGATLVIEGDYSDPANRSARIGGTDMTDPVATTDYTANTLANGAGTDLTATLVVTAQYGSNRVKYSIFNNSVSSGFITKLQARGRTLLDYTPVDSTSTDSTSITTYGERSLDFDMPYESTVGAAQEVGDYIVSVWSSPSPVSVAMPLIPANNTDLATIIALEPGDPITIVESVTGLSNDYFINGVSMRFEDYQTINVEWTLQKALARPVVKTSTTSGETSNVTSHSVSMPSGITVGDLLVSVVAMDDNATITWPAGWTEFVTTSSFLGTQRGSVAWREADGTEGSSITVTSGSAQQSTHVTMRIQGAEVPTTQPPEGASNTQDPITLQVDPPSLTPTGGAKEYLWLAVAIFNDTLLVNYALPSGYASVAYKNSSGGDVWATAVAQRVHLGASEDPSPFVLDTGGVGSRGWLAFTCAIHPAA